MNGKQLLAAGLVAVTAFLLLRGLSATAATRAGGTPLRTYNTDGDVINLRKRSDGAIVDQYGKVWT